MGGGGGVLNRCEGGGDGTGGGGGGLGGSGKGGKSVADASVGDTASSRSTSVAQKAEGHAHGAERWYEYVMLAPSSYEQEHICTCAVAEHARAVVGPV